jgi:hypothetical protein
VIIDFEKERRKRSYPDEDGFHEFVQIIVPIRKNEEEQRFLSSDCTFLTNSDFFYEQMMDSDVKEKFTGNLKRYFEEYEEQLREREEGVDLIMNHVGDIEWS